MLLLMVVLCVCGWVGNGNGNSKAVSSQPAAPRKEKGLLLIKSINFYENIFWIICVCASKQNRRERELWRSTQIHTHRAFNFMTFIVCSRQLNSPNCSITEETFFHLSTLGAINSCFGQPKARCRSFYRLCLIKPVST